MGVTTATIESMSPFKLNLDFTTDDFALFLAQSNDTFSGDNPGNWSTAKQDEAVALLICHRIARKKTDVGMNSENMGGYSYSRSVPGKTGYLVEYEALIGKAGGKPYQGVRRGDYKTSRAFRTADSRLPAMDCGDTNLIAPDPQDPPP